MLVQHGFPDVPRSFTHLLQALGAAGYRAIAPWLRGYAPSPLDGPYDADHVAEDVLALADHFSPRAPVMLVGHDWGAVITYPALAAAPDRFRCAVTLSVPHPATILENLRRRPSQLARSSYMGLLAAPWAGELAVRANDFQLVELAWKKASPPREVLAEIKETLRRSLPAPLGYYRAALVGTLPAAQRVKRAGHERDRIRVPTLNVVGERDVIKPELADGQERRFAGPFRFEVLAGAGHFLHVEQPDEVARWVLSWASEHGYGPASRR